MIGRVDRSQPHAHLTAWRSSAEFRSSTIRSHAANRRRAPATDDDPPGLLRAPTEPSTTRTTTFPERLRRVAEATSHSGRKILTSTSRRRLALRDPARDSSAGCDKSQRKQLAESSRASTRRPLRQPRISPYNPLARVFERRTLRRLCRIICSSSHLFRPTVSALSLEIIQYPHPTLRHLSKPIKKVDAELRAMVAEMFELMYKHEGVGLAANQVNLPYRLFRGQRGRRPQIKEAGAVFINPVLSKGRGQVEQEEGCLSIPTCSPGRAQRDHSRSSVRLAGQRNRRRRRRLHGLASCSTRPTIWTARSSSTGFLRPSSRTSKTSVRIRAHFRSRRETGEVPSDEEWPPGSRSLSGYERSALTLPVI